MKELKNIKEILELCDEELIKNNKETFATLDYEDLKSLNILYKSYKTQKRQLKIKNEYLKLISGIAYDYDGCNTVKSLQELIDELVELSHKAIKNDDWSEMYIGANGSSKNILQEEISNG